MIQEIVKMMAGKGMMPTRIASAMEFHRLKADKPLSAFNGNARDGMSIRNLNESSFLPPQKTERDVAVNVLVDPPALDSERQKMFDRLQWIVRQMVECRHSKTELIKLKSDRMFLQHRLLYLNRQYQLVGGTVEPLPRP